MSRQTEHRRLRAARTIYSAREGAPTAGDRWFSLYLAAFISTFYVVPVAYAVGGFLDDAAAVRATSADASPYVVAILTGTAVISLWGGRLQGPVFLTPYLGHTLLGTDISRRRVLTRPTIRIILGAGLGAAGGVGFGVLALLHAGALEWDEFGLIIVAAALGGVFCGLLAFLGQRLRANWLVALSAVLCVSGGVGLLLPQSLVIHPAGWIATLWSGGSAFWLFALAVTAAMGLVVMMTIPAALGQMPSSRVLSQSIRLTQARLFTSTGNVNDAVQVFRSKPRRVLQRAAVGGSSPLLSGLRQDGITAIRSPGSLAIAAALIPSGAALLAYASQAVGAELHESRLALTVPMGIGGMLAVFVGTGSLTEGWRHVKQEFDAAALFGWAPRTALLRRVPWPVLGTTLLCCVGSLGAIAASGSGSLGLSAWGWVLALSIAAVSARFFQCMRSRDIPVESLAPTVIPGGIDMSAVKILIWLGDGAIMSVTCVLAVVMIPWDSAALAAVLGTLILVALVWGWTRTGQSIGAPSAGFVSPSLKQGEADFR